MHKNGDHVTIRPETMGKSAMLGSFEDALAMSKAMEGVQPCLDFAHLCPPRDGTLNTYEMVSPAGEIRQRTWREYLKNLHIHLSGIEYGPKGEKNHLPLADADFGLESPVQSLA